MKVVITGGHLSPALSIIGKLKNHDVFYIGRKYVFEGDLAVSLEYQEITKLGIPFYPIKTARLQRKVTKHTFFSLTKFPLGFYKALKILREIKPDVVLGFGGYVQMPVILAAHFLKIPIVIHEQTLGAGFSNKTASYFANKICISWEPSRDHFPKEKTILTGNPLKEEIINLKKKTEENKAPVIYITGGSSGSHAINQLVEKTLDNLLQKYIIVHQVGDSSQFNDYEKLLSKKETLIGFAKKNYHLKKFLNSSEAADALNTADLVIGRSGINTVTELIYLEKPSFLIPLPYGQKDEQLRNAEFLKNLGICEFVNQDLLTDKLFVQNIDLMIENLSDYKLKQKVFLNDSSEKIINVLENVSKKKTA